ncbi:MAG: methionyl-tRNA formyltransferase [Candidatus Promineifilaceae bacterium]
MNRVVFMGTPQFSVPSLRTLIETQEVVGVVTQPDRPAGRGRQLKPSPVKVVAESAGIPIYQPRSLRSEEAAVPLHEWQPDVIVVAAFGQILRPHVLELPPEGCVNVHASLLPRWRGASPIQHAILAGDEQTGITLMQMDKGMDTGAIYVQEITPISADDTSATLHDRLAELGAQMLRSFLDDIVNGRLQAKAQDDELATHAPMIKKEAGQIEWQESAAAIDRLIRAMTPWPGAYTEWDGQYLKILAARPQPARSLGVQPGTVALVDGELLVQTGEGALALDQVQPSGKKAQDAEAFVRGRPQFDGALLGSR